MGLGEPRVIILSEFRHESSTKTQWDSDEHRSVLAHHMHRKLTFNLLNSLESRQV